MLRYGMSSLHRESISLQTGLLVAVVLYVLSRTVSFTLVLVPVLQRVLACSHQGIVVFLCAITICFNKSFPEAVETFERQILNEQLDIVGEVSLQAAANVLMSPIDVIGAK